jgi:hypothetical protein
MLYFTTVASKATIGRLCDANHWFYRQIGKRLEESETRYLTPDRVAGNSSQAWKRQTLAEGPRLP